MAGKQLHCQLYWDDWDLLFGFVACECNKIYYFDPFIVFFMHFKIILCFFFVCFILDLNKNKEKDLNEEVSIFSLILTFSLESKFGRFGY